MKEEEEGRRRSWGEVRNRNIEEKEGRSIAGEGGRRKHRNTEGEGRRKEH